MKKSIVISLHLLYWLPRLPFEIYYIWYYYTHSIPKPEAQYFVMFLNLANLIVGLISFYLFYFYLFPKYLAKKRIKTFILYGFGTLVILSLMLSYFYYNFHPYNIKGLGYLSKVDYLQSIYSAFSSMLVTSTSGCLLKGFISWYSEIRVKEQLVRKNLQTELALLKAQINPHFLFNTINNIDVLIQKDAKAASKYLNQLSDIIRFMLYETSSELIPLFKELEYIQKYIELQKIRTVNGKFVNFSVSGSTEKILIAPAIFIPFIENAFKHSTNKKVENAININLEIVENTITFTCLNIFDNSEAFKQSESGLGIELIKQRLHLLYNEKYELNIKNFDNQFEIKLKISTQ